LRLRVQLCVLDRLGHLRGNRRDELDLVLRELTRLDRAYVERSGQALPGDDRDGEDRLVLIFREVRELLEPRIEMRLRRDHDRPELGGGRAGDALARPHPRAPCHRLDARSVRRAQHQLVRPLVVEVDEARVGTEHVGDLARNQREHLLEVERGVDRRDRLGEQAQVPLSYIHPNS
jgi:hypothetical protein